MSEWREASIGDYAKVIGGYAFKSSHFKETGDYSVIKIKNISSGVLDMSECQYVSTEVVAQAERNKAVNGDILIAMTGSHITQPSSMVGRVTRFNSTIEAYINQRVGKIISLDKNILDEDFLYYFMIQDDTTYSLANIASGSANQANISAEQITSLPFAIPSIEEQRAVAKILTSLDNKIDLLTRQNATLEKLSQTYFKQWFMGEEGKNWEDGKIGDYIEVKGGTTPSTKVPEYWDGDIYWTTPKDLSDHNSVYLFNTLRKITDKGLSQISSGLLPSGTVLLSSRAPIGYLAISDIPVAINQGYIAIICENHFTNRFIFLWCKANMEQIIGASNGSTFDEISKSSFKNLTTSIPPKEILAVFDEKVKPFFEKIRLNQIQINTLQKLRNTLLPKLISGEVRIKQ